MALESFRRLALADLDDESLDRLVRHGEDLIVERKQDLPEAPRFGAAVTSFANTLGGWLLLGVTDKGAVVGFEKPDRLDLQSHLGALLRKQADPLPPFVSGMRTVEGKPIAVMRVFESTDLPHLVRGTGAVYVRTSKGKERIDDHRTLLSLARRGGEAGAAARERLVSLPLIQRALIPPDVPPGWLARTPDQDHVVMMLRAAPLTVTPSFAEWPISRAGADWCRDAAGRLTGRREQPGPDAFQREPQARGVVVRCVVLQPLPSRHQWGTVVAADSGGIIAALQRRSKTPVLDLDVERRETMEPLLHCVADALATSEAIGRAALDCWLCLPGDVHVRHVSNMPPANAERGAREVHVSGEVTIPADDDAVEAVTSRWAREYGRYFGLEEWE